MPILFTVLGLALVLLFAPAVWRAHHGLHPALRPAPLRMAVEWLGSLPFGALLLSALGSFMLGIAVAWGVALAEVLDDATYGPYDPSIDTWGRNLTPGPRPDPLSAGLVAGIGAFAVLVCLVLRDRYLSPTRPRSRRRPAPRGAAHLGRVYPHPRLGRAHRRTHKSLRRF